MICRHGPNDPNCSSNQPQYYYAEPKTPDASKYSIVDVHR